MVAFLSGWFSTENLGYFRKSGYPKGEIKERQKRPRKQPVILSSGLSNLLPVSKACNQTMLMQHMVHLQSTHHHAVQIPKQTRPKPGRFGKRGPTSAQHLACLVSLAEQTQTPSVPPKHFPSIPSLYLWDARAVWCPSALYKTNPDLSQSPVGFPLLSSP